MFRRCALMLVATAAFATSVDYLIWIPRSESADPLYRFVKDGKAGYIDSTGRVVISPRFESHGNSGGEFHDGLLEIAASDGRYIDRTGKVVIDRDLYRGWEFSEGLAAAMRKGEHVWGYIDTSGEFAIPPRFPTVPKGYVSSFSDGLAMIDTEGKYGYVDHSGEFVIKPQFLHGESFRGGMARVVTEGPCILMTDAFQPRLVGGADANTPCKIGYINRSGRVITKARFDSARDFSEGLAPVRVDDLWGFINEAGEFAITPRFADAESFSSGLSRIRDGALYGYVDHTGAVGIRPQYESAESFREGFAVVASKESGSWYIDQRGDRAIAKTFAAASPFFKGLAHVQLLEADSKRTGARFAYINTKGQVVFQY